MISEEEHGRALDKIREVYNQIGANDYFSLIMTEATMMLACQSDDEVAQNLKVIRDGIKLTGERLELEDPN